VPQGVIVWLLRLGVADAASFALSTLIVLSGGGNLPGAWLYRAAAR
jgi:hypothetical protein